MSELLLNLIILIVASIVLIRAATLLVHGITIISRFLKLSEFTVAFILMGFVTSIPEMAVAFSASYSGEPLLALGTAIGSNLTDLTLIIALPTLVAGGIKVRSIIAQRDTFLMAIFAMSPIILMLDGELTRTDGLILLGFYGFYLYRLISQRAYFSNTINHVTHKQATFQVFKLLIGTVLLFGASHFIVRAAGSIASLLDIPVVLVGLILVSAGTSLPELTFELKAVSLHHERQMLGDILGSVVANSTVIIAIATLIKPIHVNAFTELSLSTVFLVIVLIMFLIGVHSDKKLEVKEALVLLGLYFLYLFSELGLELLHKSAQPFSY